MYIKLVGLFFMSFYIDVAIQKCFSRSNITFLTQWFWNPNLLHSFLILSPSVALIYKFCTSFLVLEITNSKSMLFFIILNHLTQTFRRKLITSYFVLVLCLFSLGNKLNSHIVHSVQ